MKTIAQITEEYLNRQNNAEFESITINSFGTIRCYKNVSNYKESNCTYSFDYIDSSGTHHETILGGLVQSTKKIND